VRGLGQSMSQTLEMWRKILPLTVPEWVMEEVKKICRPSRGGHIRCGGGYLMIASEHEIEGAVRIRVRY